MFFAALFISSCRAYVLFFHFMVTADQSSTVEQKQSLYYVAQFPYTFFPTSAKCRKACKAVLAADATKPRKGGQKRNDAHDWAWFVSQMTAYRDAVRLGYCHQQYSNPFL
jgi:hypothetical protein